MRISTVLSSSILIISVLLLKHTTYAGVISTKVFVTDEEITEKWADFKIENNLVMDEKEEKLRFEIFKQDYINVKLHNLEYENRKETFEACINQFSAMTQDEYLMKFTIQKLASMNALNNLTDEMPEDMPPPSIVFDSVSLDNIPDSFDWRDFDYVSKPENQYNCGSCWAFASASAVETLYANKLGKLVELSKQEILDCNAENYACDGGWPINGFFHAFTQGLVEVDQYRLYDSRINNCSNDFGEAKRYKIKGYASIPYGDEEMIKRVVATYGPVTVAIDASDWGFSHYLSGIYSSDRCRKDLSNHAALIVGYGTDEDNQDYWIVKNSWGEEWGQNGYIKIARNKNNMCGIASVAVYAFL